jgi:microcystin-dependent protein
VSTKDEADLIKRLVDRITALERATSKIDPGAARAGDVVTTTNTTLPDRWFWLDGATITNCQTLYPTLWAAAPTAWRSGSNLVLPNSDGRVIMLETGTPGGTGGSTALTLLAANIPPLSHSLAVNIAHDHANSTLPNHVHSNTHGHTASASDESPLVLDSRSVWTQRGAGAANGLTVTAGTAAASGFLTQPLLAHDHTITVNNYTGNPTTRPAIGIAALVTTSVAVTGTVAAGAATALTLPAPPNLQLRARIYAGASN